MRTENTGDPESWAGAGRRYPANLRGAGRAEALTAHSGPGSSVLTPHWGRVDSGACTRPGSDFCIRASGLLSQAARNSSICGQEGGRGSISSQGRMAKAGRCVV